MNIKDTFKNATRTKDAVTTTKAVIDSNYFEASFKIFRRLVIEIAGNSPASVAVKYYLAHAQLLDSAISSVKKIEPIDQSLSQLEVNIKNFVEKINGFIKDLNTLPKEPFEGINLLVLWMNMNNEKKYINFYNSYLQEYNNSIKDLLTIALEYENSFTLILNETPQKILQLRNELEKIKKDKASSFDIIFTSSVSKKLDFLEFDLIVDNSETPIKKTRHSIRSSIIDLYKILDGAKKYEMQ